MGQKCVIVGASHAGVNFAFNLRREAWQGDIILIDKDPNLPYHRPPLSKEYLSNSNIEGSGLNPIKSLESYEKENIQLALGIEVMKVDRKMKTILLSNGSELDYTKLVIATGARAYIPNIQGIDEVDNLFYLRQASDVKSIRNCLDRIENPLALIIGGGYIGLETAASLSKINVDVTVVEREERILARVTSTEMSDFFTELHTSKGVNIQTNQDVVSIRKSKLDGLQVNFANGSTCTVDLVVVGVGIKVNTEIWADAGIEIENGIRVNEQCITNDENIFAIGDCTNHYNAKYDTYLRLESVQNAVDQAKLAAAVAVGKDVKYNAIPWFWSDQFDVKLQMVGIANAYDEIITRKSFDEDSKFSLWYFRNKELLCVAAVNDARSYMIGMKALKDNRKINLEVLKDVNSALSPKTIFM